MDQHLLLIQPKKKENNLLTCSYCGLDSKQIVYRDWCKIYTLRLCYTCAIKLIPEDIDIKNLIICEICGNRFNPKKEEHKICYSCWKKRYND